MIATVTSECFRFSIRSIRFNRTGLIMLPQKGFCEGRCRELSRTSQGFYCWLLVGCAAEGVFYSAVWSCCIFLNSCFFHLFFFSQPSSQEKKLDFYVRGLSRVRHHFRCCISHISHLPCLLPLWVSQCCCLQSFSFTLFSLSCGWDPFFYHFSKTSPLSFFFCHRIHRISKLKINQPK